MNSKPWGTPRPGIVPTMPALLALLSILAVSACATPNQIVNGRREGPWTTHYQFGQKQEAGSYENGQRTGTWKRWNINGELQWVMNFQEGRRHGPYVAFYNTGKPRERGQFVQGKKAGEWIRYFPGGKGAQRIVYEDGELVSREDLDSAPPLPASHRR